VECRVSSETWGSENSNAIRLTELATHAKEEDE
jgi:hypothetical protein